MWKEVELKKDFWEPVAIGDTIIGVLVGVEVGTFGKDYTLQEEETKEMVKLPAHAIIKKLMEGVKVGSRCKLEYKGERPTTKGNPVQIYKLGIWEDDN